MQAVIVDDRNMITTEQAKLAAERKEFPKLRMLLCAI
jgi:hypothetical protein